MLLVNPFTACFDVGASTGGYIVGFVADGFGYAAAWATPGVLCVVGLAALLSMVKRDRVRVGLVA